MTHDSRDQGTVTVVTHVHREPLCVDRVADCRDPQGSWGIWGRRMLGQLRGTSPRAVGPYVTLARLGAGGMGEVFLARPERLAAGYGPADLVAMKVIRNEVARDAEYLRRFAREVAVAASVTSPYVARLRDSDVTEELPWLATEFVVGPTLAQAVGRHGRLPPGALVRLGEGMARALVAVHAAGATHRDLKPANVLLAADGPRLIDFGVARTRTATTLTSTGHMVGTPAYMSPEHIAGGRHVGAASDVFCLASVLAYAATGRDLFGDGPVAAVLYRVAQAEAQLDALPAELLPLVAASLAKDPASRPTADELVERFAALRLAHGEERDGSGAGWPAPVARDIEDERRDVTALCATGTALLPLPNPPTGQEPDAGRPLGVGTLAPHQFPTMGPTPPAPAVHPAPRFRGRLRALAVVAAFAVAGAGVGAYLALRGAGDGNGSEAGGAVPAPTTTLTPAQLVAQAGVDASGAVDRSGYVPQFAAQRAPGWKPWRGRLGGARMNCSADTRALVCLLTNGTYEAVSTADGHRLWVSGSPPAAEDSPGEAYFGPGNGTLFMPGDTLAPQVRGGHALIASDGALQLRDSRTGDVRWKVQPPSGRGELSAQPLLADDTVIATVEGKSFSDEPSGASLRAYDVTDGSTRWDLTLDEGDGPSHAEEGLYAAQALIDGVVYARTPDGLVAVDARKGVVLGRASPTVGTGCRAVSSGGGTIQCESRMTDAQRASNGDKAEIRVDRYTPRTLEPVGHYVYLLDQKTTRADVTVTATDSTYSLARRSDDGSDTGLIVLTDLRTGKQTQTLRSPVIGPSVSAPLLVDGQAVFADNHSLYVTPLDRKSGRLGKPRAIPLPGAPSDRSEPQDDGNGIIIRDQIRPPQVLMLGGVVHVVFDRGTISSVRLP
ncbi:protein kinase [Streptomyces brevispora]|uniref:protein kinase domain-containing protein n=1 Tax=Streptomyces brevispora TaxID=887462 RepID=UPI00371ABD07